MIEIIVDEKKIGNISKEKFNEIERNAYKNPINYGKQAYRFFGVFFSYVSRQITGILASIVPVSLVLVLVFPEFFQAAIEYYKEEGLVALVEFYRPYIVMVLVLTITFSFLIHSIGLMVNNNLFDSAFNEEILIECAKEIEVDISINDFFTFRFVMVEDNPNLA